MATGIGVKSYTWEDFSGGLNSRDSAFDVRAPYFESASNINIVEAGKGIARRGTITSATGATWNLPVSPSAKSSAGSGLWFLASLGSTAYLLQVGNTLYRSVAGTWVSTATFSTTDSIAVTEFNGEAVLCHPVDGIYTWSGGASITNRSATAKGSSIAVWQNKVWAGDGETLWWSNAGDSHTWTTGTDFVKVREKDSESITCLLGGGSGLIVFKANSMYRVNDSTTGSYQTVDWFNGAGYVAPSGIPQNQSQSVIQLDGGEILAANVNGIYRGTGFSGLKLISAHVLELAMSALVDKVVRMARRGRKILIVMGSSLGVGNDYYEYDIDSGYFLLHTSQMTTGSRPRVIGITSGLFGTSWYILGLFQDGTGTPVQFSGILSGVFDQGNMGTADIGCTLTTASVVPSYYSPNTGLLARCMRITYLGSRSTISTSLPTTGITWYDENVTNKTALTTPSTVSGGGLGVSSWEYRPYSLGRYFAPIIQDASSSTTQWQIDRIRMDCLPVEQA